jgi:hypothetical protein
MTAGADDPDGASLRYHSSSRLDPQERSSKAGESRIPSLTTEAGTGAQCSSLGLQAAAHSIGSSATLHGERLGSEAKWWTEQRRLRAASWHALP